MAFKTHCIEKNKNKIIVLQEKKSKISFHNEDRSEVTLVNVDGCEITAGIRCDHLVLKNNYEYYVELKGQDLDHAIDQLISTVDQLTANKDATKNCYIICTRSPLTAAKIQNLQVVFKKRYKANLIVKSSPYSCSI